MKLSIYLIILIITVLGLSSCTKSPDTIFVNGKVYSLDNNNTQYEAIAVKDGKIFELGKTEDFKSKYSKAKLVDLQGKTVIPGLIDCEANLALFSRYLSYIQIEKFTNREDIKTKVKEKVSIHVEKALTEQDELYSQKLEQLLKPLLLNHQQQ